MGECLLGKSMLESAGALCVSVCVCLVAILPEWFMHSKAQQQVTHSILIMLGNNECESLQHDDQSSMETGSH